MVVSPLGEREGENKNLEEGERHFAWLCVGEGVRGMQLFKSHTHIYTTHRFEVGFLARTGDGGLVNNSIR